MKLNKTLIILSLLLVFCISLGAVSATEDISVNDTTDNSVTTVESSAMNEEISAVGDEEIHYSSEIAKDIGRGALIYYIEHDYIIDKTWVADSFTIYVIDGQGHTIYGNGNQAFHILGNGVEIRNLNFVNCSDNFVRENDVITNRGGGAIYFVNTGEVVNCSFVNCSANGNGGAIYFENSVNVRYCIFDNNKATGKGDAIYSDRDKYFNNVRNFFSFKDYVSSFPNDLIILEENRSFTPKDWVVLSGSVSGGEYILKFFNNVGTVVTRSLPDYTARLVVGSEEKIITIHNNTFSCEYDPTKTYRVYSLNTGELLTVLNRNSDNGSDPVFKPKVILTVDDIKGTSKSTVKVNISVLDFLGRSFNEGTVTISLNGKEYTAKVVNGIATFNIFIPSKEGIYTAKVLFNGEGTRYANTTCDFTVTSVEDNNTTGNDKEINKSIVSNKINTMENCGTPLIALLIALISLPLIRRK